MNLVLFVWLVAEWEVSVAAKTPQWPCDVIVEAGEVVLPNVLRSLEEEMGPLPWIKILERITHLQFYEDGDPFRQRDKWIEWGREEGYL